MSSKKLSAIIQIGGAVAGSLLGSIDKTKTKLDSVGQSLRNLESQQAKLGRTIQTFGREGKTVDAMRQRYQALTREIDKQRTVLEKVQRIESQRNQRNRLGGEMVKTAAIGAAVAAPAALTFKNASEFNYGLQAIGNTANMKPDAIKKMGREILDMSEKVGQYSDNLQKGVGYLIASGDEADKAMAKIEAIGRVATAADAEIEDVAKASYTLQDALKIDPTKMGRSLEMLVQAGKEGKFEFKNMAAELPVLGASFQALKFTGEDAVTSMGAYLQIAMKGASTQSEAANNMANFLNKILSPETLKKSEQLGGNLYGIVSNAQNKGENPIDAAIKEINRITKGGDQKLLGELFGDMQVQNFVRPVLQNLKEYEAIKEKIVSSKDVVDKDFVAMMATSKKQTDLLAIASDNLAKSVGTSLEPAFGKVATVLVPIVQRVRDFTEANKELIGNVIIGVGVFLTIRTAILGVRLAMTALSVVMMANPIGLAVAAIGAAAFLVITNWEPIKAFFITLWHDIVEVFDKSINNIVGKIEWMLGKYEAAKSKVTNFGSGIGDSVYNGVQSTKSFFGVDDAQTRAYEATQRNNAPPSMASKRGGGGTITDNSQTTYQIYQQPGQDPNALAAALSREQERRREIMKRGNMFDGVMAQ